MTPSFPNFLTPVYNSGIFPFLSLPPKDSVSGHKVGYCLGHDYVFECNRVFYWCPCKEDFGPVRESCTGLRTRLIKNRRPSGPCKVQVTCSLILFLCSSKKDPLSRSQDPVRDC